MKRKYLSNPLHFHPDVELLLVIKGTGTLIVKDSIERFKPGHLVLIGENTPHAWHSDKEYMEDNELFTEVIFILFKKDVFGIDLWQLPESKNIGSMLMHSMRGIKIGGNTRFEVSRLMDSFDKTFGFNRLILLFTILEKITSNKEFQYLSSPSVVEMLNKKDSNRLSSVYKYLINNYQENVTVEKAASIANLSVPAFCRYFKNKTSKTFIQFLNEIRIKNACQLLSEEDFSISTICYNCGYSGMSYFIKKFKGVMGCTPTEYRKKVNRE